MIKIDLTGRRAFVAGVADERGYGFAIAKALAEAGATVSAGTWPPALNIFRKLISSGKIDEARRLADGGLLEFERIYPLDVAYDTLEDVPADIQANKRYQGLGDYTLRGVREQAVADFGPQPFDIVIHSVANSPEVKNPLMETSRQGYLAALSASSYSLIGLLREFAPLMRPGGAFLSLSYLAGRRVVPGYGGGMSSAKAALESDTQVLAFEAGTRYGLRVNCISAGPLASRAATAIGTINQMIDLSVANSPLPEVLQAAEVAAVAAFLCSPLASGITGTTVFVDKGYNIMAPSGAHEA
ncbi:MAG TPA: enoyl-[acyl-carrier-protein] reductase [Herpetosiphonaceae bacterium]